jgi:hypothetical protein
MYKKIKNFDAKQYIENDYDKTIEKTSRIIDLFTRRVDVLKYDNNINIKDETTIKIINIMDNKIMKMRSLLEKIQYNHYLNVKYIKKYEHSKTLFNDRDKRFRDRQKKIINNIKLSNTLENTQTFLKRKRGRPSKNSLQNIIKLNIPFGNLFDIPPTITDDNNKYIENNLLDFLYCNHPDYTMSCEISYDNVF